MLVVVEKGKEHLAEEVFRKWEITYAHIGQVTDTGRVRYYMNGTLEGDIPAESLVLGGGAPVYKREWTIPAYFAEIEKFDIASIADISPEEAKTAAMQLCAEPNIASKRWVYEQYDSMVGTVNQSTNRPSDASVVMVKGTNKSLALTVDCNSRYIFADPDKGTQIAVAEASRNIRVTGGVPTGVTNCLNFGNPYNKEVYYQFKHAIDGMGKACRKFDTPVTGGNVSFYNQSTNGNAVYPTPTIGMVGIIEKPEHRMTLDFKKSGDLIYLVGEAKNDLGSSQYLAKLKGVEYSPCPQFDLDEEYAVQMAVYNSITAGLLNSAHDISEGGLFVACLESAMAGGTGFDICTLSGIRNDAWLFGESQSRAVVSISESNKAAFESAMQQAGVKALHIGTVTGSGVTVNGQSWGEVEDFAKPYNSVIAEAIG
jgi:phosphoribosylformylglycinamidine synthase